MRSPDEYKAVFAKRLKEKMAESGVTQEQAAAWSGVSQPSVGSWLKGVTAPQIHQAAALACRLNVSLDWLSGASDDSPAETPSISPKDLALLRFVHFVQKDPIKAEEISRYIDGDRVEHEDVIFEYMRSEIIHERDFGRNEAGKGNARQSGHKNRLPNKDADPMDRLAQEAIRDARKKLGKSE